MRSYTKTQTRLIERFEELKWPAIDVDEFLEKHFDGKPLDLLTKTEVKTAISLLKKEKRREPEELSSSKFNLREYLERAFGKYRKPNVVRHIGVRRQVIDLDLGLE